MSLFNTVLNDITVKAYNKKNNILDGIPFPFEKFRPYVPVLEKGVYTGILGSPGTRKE